jgi:hypothetical protein
MITEAAWVQGATYTSENGDCNEAGDIVGLAKLAPELSLG